MIIAYMKGEEYEKVIGITLDRSYDPFYSGMRRFQRAGC